MNNKMIFVVTNREFGKEYFSSRDAAIDYIIDNYSMGMVFRTPVESEKLREYLSSHDATPNQYDFKYTIGTIPLNTDYDTPKSIYMVFVERVESGASTIQHRIFDTQEDARTFFDDVVDTDLKDFGNEGNGVTCQLSPYSYERWSDKEFYAMEHLLVELTEYTANGIEYETKSITETTEKTC